MTEGEQPKSTTNSGLGKRTKLPRGRVQSISGCWRNGRIPELNVIVLRRHLPGSAFFVTERRNDRRCMFLVVMD